jgi:hypothetical protein
VKHDSMTPKSVHMTAHMATQTVIELYFAQARCRLIAAVNREIIMKKFVANFDSKGLRDGCNTGAYQYSPWRRVLYLWFLIIAYDKCSVKEGVLTVYASFTVRLL